MNIVRTLRRGITVIAIAALCALIALPAYAAYEDSLKGYWKMDGKLGDELSSDDGTIWNGLNSVWHMNNNWNDSSGNGRNGTGYNGVTFTSPAVFGGYAGSFDGSNDYVVLSSGFSFPNNGAFSASAWVRTTNTAASDAANCIQNVIFGTAPGASNLNFGVDGGKITSHNYTNSWQKTKGSINVADGNWHLLTWSRTTSGGIAMYVDGTLDATDTNPVGGTVSTRFGDYNSTYFSGSMDELASWNRALSSTEVEELYERGAAKNEIGTSYGRLNNGAVATTGKFGNALSFDGSNDYVVLTSGVSFPNNADFTASAWIKTTNSATAGDPTWIQNVIFGTAPGASNLNFGVDNGKITSHNYTSSWQKTRGSIDVADGEWHLLTWSRTTDGGIKMYVDGVLDGTDTNPVGGTVMTRIGNYNNGYLSGAIDDVGVWSRALSVQEIKSIYRFGAEAFENSMGTWNSTGTTDWSSGWSQTGIPTALKDAYVDSGTAVVSTSGDVAKDLYVGYETGDSGAISITTGDLTAANEYIGRTGTGTVTQTGGTNTISDTLYIGQNSGSTGTYNLQGGVLKAYAIALGSGTSSFNFTGGTLKIYTFTGDLVIGDNALIAPGSSPGTADVYGDFVLNGAYQAELGGLTPGAEYDQIVVHGGNITLGADSIIELAAWNSFVPEIGDTFVLMDWDEGYTFTDNGYEFDPGTYGLPGEWMLSINGTQFEAMYTGASVPELPPFAAQGVALALGSVGAWVRAKRKGRKG